MKAAKTSGKKGSRSNQSLFRVKGGGKRQRMRRSVRNKKIKLRQTLDLLRSSSDVFKALMGGTRINDVIGFQRICNAARKKRVKALSGLTALWNIRHSDGSAGLADSFSDSYTEPMDVDPEPTDTEPQPIHTDSEPMCIQSQPVTITITITAWIWFLGSCTLISQLFLNKSVWAELDSLKFYLKGQINIFKFKT